MRALGLLAWGLLSACSDGANTSADSGNALGAPASDVPTMIAEGRAVIDTKAGRYRVEVNPKLDVKSLPSNADMKMVDGDIAQYAVKLCQLDFSNKLRAERCDVYVQSDPSGLLVGYVTLQQGSSVTIETALETNRGKTGSGCFVGGKLENLGYDNPNAKLDIARDFTARVPFFAWEKSPGDWMVSFNDEDPDENSAGGMWYVEHQNNKLRLSQERWNYCYKDSAIRLDEVFSHAVTLTRS